uniref:transposase n=1 Tax=Kyrpidia spormannii TaxID=2055160 RepID=UPI0038B30FCF
MDDVVRALGLDGISKSEVSRLCKQLDEDIQQFKGRPLEREYPYVWLDATFPKDKDNAATLLTQTVILRHLTRLDQTGRRLVHSSRAPESDGGTIQDRARKYQENLAM